MSEVTQFGIFYIVGQLIWLAILVLIRVIAYLFDKYL